MNYLLIFLLDHYLSRRTREKIKIFALLFSCLEDFHASVSVSLVGVNTWCSYVNLREDEEQSVFQHVGHVITGRLHAYICAISSGTNER